MTVLPELDQETRDEIDQQTKDELQPCCDAGHVPCWCDVCLGRKPHEPCSQPAAGVVYAHCGTIGCACNTVCIACTAHAMDCLANNHADLICTLCKTSAHYEWRPFA